METETIDIGAKFIFDEMVKSRVCEMTMVFGDFIIQGRLSACDDLKLTVARITHEGETYIGEHCQACGSVIHYDGYCV